MFSFVIKRLLQAILVMLIVTLIAFLLFQFVGDPVTQTRVWQNLVNKKLSTL